VTRLQCLQCFDAVGRAAGRACSLQKTEWWDAGVVICMERGADLHIAQLMPLLLTWDAGVVICMERGADLHIAQLMPLLLTWFLLQ